MVSYIWFVLGRERRSPLATGDTQPSIGFTGRSRGVHLLAPIAKLRGVWRNPRARTPSFLFVKIHNKIINKQKTALGGGSLFYIFISMSTPAGRLREDNDSITFGVGLGISMRRL